MIQINDNNPLVSIVMPVYNSPDLFASIDSVLSQTYPNIEFLMLDDCSKSFDKEVIKKYIAENSHENIKRYFVEVHSVNLGTVKTMNELFRLSSGEYVYTLACDDIFFDNDVIRDWTDEFIRSKADFITAKRECVSFDLKESLEIQPGKKQRRWLGLLPPKLLYRKIIPENFIFGCCTARSRKSFCSVGLLDERYKLIDDYPFYLSILRRGVPVHFYDRIVVKYRAGGVSNPQNVNDFYLSESDEIMENEVFPFVDSRKIRYRYSRWKDSVKGISEYDFLREKWKDYRLVSDLIFLRFNLGKMIKDFNYFRYIFLKRYFKRGSK